MTQRLGARNWGICCYPPASRNHQARSAFSGRRRADTPAIAARGTGSTSGCGTKPTCRDVRLDSAFRGKPDLTIATADFRFRPEADFVFDSRDVRLLVSPDRGSVARLDLQTRGYFVTQFTPFISEFGYKGAALSDEMAPSTALTQGTLGDECTRQHHPLHHHDGDRRVRRTSGGDFPQCSERDQPSLARRRNDSSLLRTAFRT